MKFEEFRSLVEERKRLIHDFEEKNLSRIKEIDQRVFPRIWEIYHILDGENYIGYTKHHIKLLFEVGFKNIVDILQSYFKNNAEVDCNMHDGSIFVTPQPARNYQYKSYALGCYNDTLYCLFSDGQRDWEKLLHDYPDLRDYLWENFKSLKQQEKRAQVSLIQKMLKEKNQEQEVLENPELREAKITEIKKEKKELESMLSLVKNSFDEIDV